MDLFDGSHQLLSLALIDVHLAGAAEFRRFPEGVVKIWECCQMLRLEIVGPENQQFLLGLLGLILLDGHEPGEGVVVGGLGCGIT